MKFFGWLKRAADAVSQGARKAWPTAWPATVILFVAFCGIGLLLAQSSQEANLVAAIGMTVAIVTALIQGGHAGHGSVPAQDGSADDGAVPAPGGSDGTRAGQDRHGLGAVAIALPTAAVLALLVSGMTLLYLGNGPLDVLDRVSVQQPAAGLGHPAPKFDRGFVATVEVRAPQSRKRLTVEFQASDHDPAQQSCVPNGGTRLEVVLDQQGNRRTVRNELRPGEPVVVEFTTPPNTVRLRVRVTNEKDRSCVMDLSVSRADYTTWPAWIYPSTWF